MSVFDQSYHHKTSGCLGVCTESSATPLFSTSGQDDNHEKSLLTREDQQKHQEINMMLSQAFNALTFEDRQLQQEVLHGVADVKVEDTSLIENSLQELVSHLAKIKAGRVYEIAERQGPAYVYARSFRVAFLRAARYDAKTAAERMLRFFDWKEKLFGTEKLTKDITIDDLNEDDMVALKAGSVQWAGRDRSNRPILLHIPSARTYKEIENELRVRYFMMMEAVKSAEIQLRGFVVVSYTVGYCKDTKQGHGLPLHSQLAETLPLFTGSFHFACDDIKQHIFHTAVIAVMPADLKARFRLHFGGHLECQYRLSTYGIPVDSFPLLLETKSVDLTPHLRWCQLYISNDHREAKNQLTELAFPSSNIRAISQPNPNDVLSAGSTKSDNLGNDRLRVLVKESVESYRSGSNGEKRLIVDRIIDRIHGAGGRFLQQDKASQIWKELPVSKVRQKINQRFRNLNRRREGAAEQARKGTLIADMPHAADVIFGGRRHRNKGTVLLLQLIKDRSDEYVSTNRSAKAVVVDGVIQRIKSEGGRFLQPSQSDLGRYVELSYDSVRDRVSTYFRNYRRPSRMTAVTS